MADTNNVTGAKPAIGGAIYYAQLNTPLPKNAITSLNKAFVGLGYVSEDGLKNENSPSSETIKAWGGDTVQTVQKEKEDTFTYKLIEALNINALKQVYGEGNVEGDLDTGITIKANAKELPVHSIVIDMILKDGILKRVVVPRAKVTEIGEITHADGDIVGYEITIQALPDAEQNTHYEYMQKPTGGNA